MPALCDRVYCSEYDKTIVVYYKTQTVVNIWFYQLSTGVSTLRVKTDKSNFVNQQLPGSSTRTTFQETYHPRLQCTLIGPRGSCLSSETETPWSTVVGGLFRPLVLKKIKVIQGYYNYVGCNPVLVKILF